MSNILQYLIQQTDEFRESYNEIDKRIDEALDKLDVIELRLKEIETRLNPNRIDDEKQYNLITRFDKMVTRWEKRDKKRSAKKRIRAQGNEFLDDPFPKKKRKKKRRSRDEYYNEYVNEKDI